MSTCAITDDRTGAILAELAEMDLAAARKAHGALMAAEGAGEIDRLGRAYQRLARSTRQSLALAQRFAREERLEERLEARQAAREAAVAERSDAPAGRPDPSRDPAVAARKAEVREVVTRLVWDEAERSEVAGLLDELDFFLEIESHERRFLEDPTPRIAARLCADLDLETCPGDFEPEAAAAEDPPDEPPPGAVQSCAQPWSHEASGGLPDRPG